MIQPTNSQNPERISAPDAELLLRGANLMRFRDWLFVPQSAHSAPGQSFHGGIPVIFPWFGDNAAHPGAPGHGFVRNAIWSVDEASDTAFQLSLNSQTATHPAWPFAFGAILKFEFSNELRIRLEIENRDVQPFRFECAFHTYFAIDDVSNVEVDGLDGVAYLDKTRGFAREIQRSSVRFDGETDRVYLEAGNNVSFSDGARRFGIKNNEGWRSTVVWNPGPIKTAQMKDLAPGEGAKFVCVECGQIGDNATTLQPGETGALDVSIGVQTNS